MENKNSNEISALINSKIRKGLELKKVPIFFYNKTKPAIDMEVKI